MANVVDLDPCEKEATMGDKLRLSIGIKAKLLRSFLDGDFENVQLNDNLMRSLRIGVSLPT